MTVAGGFDGFPGNSASFKFQQNISFNGDDGAKDDGTLSVQDNAKLLHQLNSGFKRTINWKKCHLKTEPLNAPNPYLDFLIDPSFQGVNRLFVLPFNALNDRTGHSRYYLPSVKVEGYNVMIDGKNFFGQSIKNDTKTYENIQKITTGQGDDYTSGCLLDHNYFIKLIK